MHVGRSEGCLIRTVAHVFSTFPKVTIEAALLIKHSSVQLGSINQCTYLAASPWEAKQVFIVCGERIGYVMAHHACVRATVNKSQRKSPSSERLILMKEPVVADLSVIVVIIGLRNKQLVSSPRWNLI